MTDRKQERRGLGRGLSALMADVGVGSAMQPGTAGLDVQVIAIERIRPNPDQPRRLFKQEALEELAASLREKGILQPLILREIEGGYEIVAGERRWRAAQLAQLHQVPALVKDYTDTEVLEIAIIENIQRADLSPIEEASAFRQLIEKFGHSQERLAESLGKSRSYIANALRLLTLPTDVIGMVQTGALSAGHARALVTSEKASIHARRIVDDGLTVRDAERLVRTEKSETGKRTTPRRSGRDPDTIAIEKDIEANLGMSVRIAHAPGGTIGSITIQYRNMEQLDLLCRMLNSAAID